MTEQILLQILKTKFTNKDAIEIVLPPDIPKKYRTVRIMTHGHMDSQYHFHIDEYEIINGPIKELKGKSLEEIAKILAKYPSYIKSAKEIQTKMQNFYKQNIEPYKDRYLNTGFIITRVLEREGKKLTDLSDQEIQEKFHLSRQHTEIAEKLIKDIQYYNDMIYLVD